ncbi:hypothetical protein [Klebsiella pneumoniae]
MTNGVVTDEIHYLSAIEEGNTLSLRRTPTWMKTATS